MSSDRESIARAFYAAEREADWLHYPEYDPIFQLIPLGSRPLTDNEEAARFWPHYDSDRSEHSEEPSIDPRDEYPEIFEALDQAEYRRYRLRGGVQRFRPSDIGDEPLYITYSLTESTTDGCYLDDYQHLCPNTKRIISYEYRQHIRPWFDSLEHLPTTLTELGQLWIQNWTNTFGQDGATYYPLDDQIDTNPSSPASLPHIAAQFTHSVPQRQ